MRFLPEPPHRHGAVVHGAAARTGVLLVNLGTPDAPNPKAVRRFLAEFLSDPRVIEIPRPIWWVILNGIILNVRPKDAAARYASVWMAEGSPLMVWSRRQTAALDAALTARGHAVDVVLGMRYGNPSLASAMQTLRERGCDRILVMPLYPQYSASTTATVSDAINAVMARTRNTPELRFVKHFHDDPGYIASLAARVNTFWEHNGRGQKLVLSFHGLPRRSLDLGDPYFCECQKTGRLLIAALGLTPDQVEITFQSRFGAAEWLQPYTEPTLKELARNGVTSVDVFCPGFVGDCIETLEEMAQEARDAFLAAGGTQYRYIPAINDSAPWIDALTSLVERHLQGWPTKAARSPDMAAAEARELQVQREHALELGATD
ncbi:ferrochelatase [Pigmentiphaga litoralis]|uniref:ferrochelatase n=1 Tax=Pigmentiphaga litoralis TaxID=516702 RepID=UPI003B439187